MSFHGYEKIPERLDLDEGDHRLLAKEEFAVSEKIHGANFCLLTDGEDLRVAKRKALLAEGEDFFGHQRLLGRLAGPALALHRCHAPAGGLLCVYGELFGGAYPHPAVPPVPGVEAVQTGVFYTPDIDFCVFDLAVTEDGARRYVDFEQTVASCRAVGLRTAPLLFVGRYAEAVSFPIGFPTHLPAQLGLPPLPDNLAEGVVVKPWREVPGAPRAVLKRKIDRFAEDPRYERTGSFQAAQVAPAEALPLLRPLLASLLNERRLDSALSKLGPLRPGAQAEQVLQEAAADAMVSLEAAAAQLLAVLSEEQQAVLWDDAHRLAADLIRRRLDRP